MGSSAGPHTEGVRNYLGRDGLGDLARFGVTVEPFSVARRVVRRSPRFASTIVGPSYYLVARGGGPGTLESQLLRQALEAGARVRYGRRASPREADIWAVGAPRGKVNMVAAGYRFAREGSNLPDDEIHSLFDTAVAPGGYFCVLPGPVWHSVYSCAWGNLGFQSLLDRVDRALRLGWVEELVGHARRVGRIFGKGYFADNPYVGLSANRPLVVGEAAGIQDAVGGFGIRYAVASGALAARAVLEGKDYLESLKAEFKDDFEIAMRGRAWLDSAPNGDFDAFLTKLGPVGGVPDYATWRRVRFL